jgi:hypothetical protein
MPQKYLFFFLPKKGQTWVLIVLEHVRCLFPKEVSLDVKLFVKKVAKEIF